MHSKPFNHLRNRLKAVLTNQGHQLYTKENYFRGSFNVNTLEMVNPK